MLQKNKIGFKGWGKKIKVLHKTGTFKHIFNSTRFLTFEKCHQKIKQNRNMSIINQIQPLTFFTGFLNKHGNKVMIFMSSLFYAALFRKNSFSTGLHEKDEKKGGGVQKSSMGNHRHPNMFCGMHTPQLVIRQITE